MTRKMELIGNYDRFPLIPLSYGFSIIVFAVILFAVLNYNVKRLSPTSDDTWKWRNLLISWIHALIVGIWNLSCFYYYPELTTDLIEFINPYIYSLVAFSTGYFLYDFMDIVTSSNLGKMWEVVPHHVVVAGMFLYNVVERRCVAYNVVALLSEVNTIFLHSRKLLQMHDWPFDHWLYRINSALNLLTFIGCRFLGNAWIVYGMLFYHERVSPIYFRVLSASMFVMWITNILLFSRLLQSDIIKPYFGSSRVVRRRDESLSTGGCIKADDEISANQMLDSVIGELRRRKIKDNDNGRDIIDDDDDDDDDDGNMMILKYDEEINYDEFQSDHLINGDKKLRSFMLEDESSKTSKSPVPNELQKNRDEPNHVPTTNSYDNDNKFKIEIDQSRGAFVPETSKKVIVNGIADGQP